MIKLKKKDTVIVIAGKDKGKKGEVKEVMPEARKVVVMGINIVSKHKKTTKEKPGGIHKMEAPMSISNVQLVCPKCGKTARVKISIQGGEKLRICKKCNEAII
ncbi:MAG: 50S ribosomal protein L24 [Elusimicrobiota bacterium]|nr:50S ribosomal protein L24 [Elusimicrobiota bacterium]